VRSRLDRRLLREVLLHLVNIVELVQEPLIDIRYLPYLLNRVSEVECGGNGENPFVRGIDKLVIKILNEVVLRQ